MDTTKSLKNATKNKQPNTFKHFTYLNDRTICLLGEAHKHLDGREILTFLGDRVFIDFKHSCFDCEEVVKTQKYAIEVNRGRINYPYEVYYDAYVETSFESLILYSHIVTERELHDKLEQLLNDLKAFHAEKNYDVAIETEQQKLEFLRKQDYYIEGYRQPLETDDKTVKYVLHWPPTRSFTLPLEAAAIQGLSKTPVQTNFHRKRFIIYKEEAI